jgi:hypothetical protein
VKPTIAADSKPANNSKPENVKENEIKEEKTEEKPKEESKDRDKDENNSSAATVVPVAGPSDGGKVS